MATTVSLRKGLNRKLWEMCSISPASTSAGAFIISSRHYRQQQLGVFSATAQYLYLPEEDGYVQVPSAALAGTFGAGACGTALAWSTGTTVGASFLTATAGTTTTITTNQTLARDLRGYKVLFTGGTNAGELKTIASNTIGGVAVITFTAASGVAFNATSQYRLITPTFVVLCAGSLAANILKKYDYATNTWTALTQTGLPATIGTDSKLIATPSFVENAFNSFATGTATAGGASTLTDGTKAWTVNQWTNFQIRITGGTGAGQIRTIASNTATVITTSAVWTTNPDATSAYSVEGNDDFIYYMGSNAVTLYRYSISANTWTTLAPGVARAAAPNIGMSGHWVWKVNDSAWTNESAIINGRRIYSFRGGISGALDYYDIPSNTWTNAIIYSPATETFTTGTKYTYIGDYLYIQKEATGRWFRYSFKESAMDGWNVMTYPQAIAVIGDTVFDYTYTDGATTITWIYMMLNTSTVMLRCMII